MDNMVSVRKSSLSSVPKGPQKVEYQFYLHEQLISVCLVLAVCGFLSSSNHQNR